MSEMTATERAALFSEAAQAVKRAYCPYSHFSVGAAILTEDHCIYAGCNVENASYSLTLCAERVALFKAVSEGHRKVVALAVAGGTVASPVFPCGACLQALSEFMDPAAPVFVLSPEGKLLREAAFRDFLPITFLLKSDSLP